MYSCRGSLNKFSNHFNFGGLPRSTIRNRWRQMSDGNSAFKQKSHYSSVNPKLFTTSYTKGSNENPTLLEKTVGLFFDDQVDKYANREMIRVVYQNVRWSWKELQEKVNSFALGLMELGFKKGDRLGVWMPNSAEWVVAHLATSKLGVILVNVNPAYRKHELEHAVNLVGCKGLIITPTFKQSNYIEMLNDLIPELSTKNSTKIQSAVLPTLEYLIHIGTESHTGMSRFIDHLVDIRANAFKVNKLQQIAHSIDRHDATNIQFTSGTTGLPKGATLTHHNILNNGFLVGSNMKLTPDDKVCIPVPLYHCFGLVLGNMAAMTHGASIVYPSAGFDTVSTLEAVSKERCTALHGVPTMFISELNHPDFHKYDYSMLRTGIMAGSPCPKEVMIRVMEKMNMKEITICYGMTETSPVSFQTKTTDQLQKKVETVGSIHPHVEAKVVDPQRRIVPINTPGELLIKGYLVMKGYWKDEKRTKEAIDSEGWMATGDLATIDEDGYCRIVGRIKDCIIRGGENIFPREIEEFLYKHEKIEDVQVVGVPDEKYGELVCAWIKLVEGQSATKEEIQKFCQNQIAHYKIPHYIIFVDKFPMTVTGKVQKYLMREESIRILSLEKATPKNFSFS